MKFEVSKRARRQIERIQIWWLQNRSTPSLFLDELADAEKQLREKPDLGSVYLEHKRGTVRGLLLPKTKHHLYYRHRPDLDELVVLSVWGAARERGPKL